MITTKKGTAIIVALFVVALVSAIVMLLMHMQSTAIQVVHDTSLSDRANHLAKGATLWAKDVLLHEKPNTIYPQHFNQKLPAGVVVSATLSDAQSRFNINSIVTEEGFNTFVRLLVAAHVPVGEKEIYEGVSILKESIIGNASEAKGELRNPLFSASLMVSVFPTAWYETIMPVLTALPNVSVKYNINTIRSDLLMILSPEVYRLVMSARNQKPKLTDDDIHHLNLEDTFVSKSQYFDCEIKITVENHTYHYHQLLQRRTQSVETIWQYREAV